MSTITVNQLPPKDGKRGIALGSIDWLSEAIRTVDTWRQRQKSRAQFASLDPRTLHDTGISEAQRFIEGNKPFWKA